MTLLDCWRLETAIDDLARGEDDRGAAPLALRHAISCPRCATRLASQRALTRALEALAEETAGAEAEPRLETALRTAFRMRAAEAAFEAPGPVAQPSKHRRRAWIPAVAAAVTLAVAAAAVLARFRAPIPEGPDANTSQGTPAGTMSETLATDFLPLPYADDAVALEGGQVVRVRIPRSALVSLGWPVAEEENPEPVSADVVLGYDGVARAIRFVR